MNLSEYLELQTNDAVFAFNNSARFPIGLLTPDHFPGLLRREDHNVIFDSKVKNNKAFIRTYGDRFEYWVDISYTSYRKSFLSFLERVHGLKEVDIPSDFHVDHLLNKAYAKKFGVQFVRMCLLHKDQNLSYGRKFEKNMGNIKQSKRTIFLMDFLCAMKILGVSIPANRKEYNDNKSCIVKHLEEHGVTFEGEGDTGEEQLDKYFLGYPIL